MLRRSFPLGLSCLCLSASVFAQTGPGTDAREPSVDAASANGSVTLVASDPATSSPSADEGSRPESVGSRETPPPVGVLTPEQEQLGLAAETVMPLRGEQSGSSWLSRARPGATEIARVGGALAVVIGVLLLARLMVRRGGGVLDRARRPSGVLSVLARYPVGRGQHLVLLQLGRRLVLAHQSAGGMSAITEVVDPDEVASLLSRVEAATGGTQRSFQTALRRFESDHRRLEPTRRAFATNRRTDGRDRQVVDLTQARGRWPQLRKASA
ncbi:MAG: FliO/MopB family protein [Planctomycetota bacterium]|jgi:flagellar biogenesis protein FliO